MILHDYWRSGAGYRVRIALELKGLSFDRMTHDLRAAAHKNPGFLVLAPQGLVPALETDNMVLTQSLAILEMLEERYPSSPLLPQEASDRAIVRSMAALVACDIHPLNNLRVLQWLQRELGAGEAAITKWIATWVTEGFTALEALILKHGGDFAFGMTATIADCCLIPQVYAARRFNVALDSFPCITAIAEVCEGIPAFRRAHPSRQSDAD